MHHCVVYYEEIKREIREYIYVLLFIIRGKVRAKENTYMCCRDTLSPGVHVSLRQNAEEKRTRDSTKSTPLTP